MRNRHVAGWVFAVVLAASPVLAWPADAASQLRQFVATVNSATGEFTQRTETAPGRNKAAQQSGEFMFKRPGHFKWHVVKPYEQLIVSDGVTVFQYDPDLSQVTERGVDASIGASPAAILFGSGSLDESFEIGGLPDKDGLQWMRATPRSANAGFNYVDMGFKDGLPARLDLLDSFGQVTRIELSHMVANPDIPADEFKFVAPAGTDVVKTQ